MKYISLIICGLLFFSACQSDTSYIPRPRTYHRINLPTPKYVQSPDSLPYRFEYSANAQLLPDTSAMSEPYWMNVYYPDFDANLDVSYKRIKNEVQFRDFINDSHRLANKHNIKASRIDQTYFLTDKGIPCTSFELEGDVPTQFQFFLTDSAEHFLRIDPLFPHLFGQRFTGSGNQICQGRYVSDDSDCRMELIVSG